MSAARPLPLAPSRGPAVARTDDEVVARFKEYPHFRIGYMEGALVSAADSIAAALRMLPVNRRNECARQELQGRLHTVKAALRIAAEADGR